MSHTPNGSVKRRALHEQEPRCHWCRRPTNLNQRGRPRSPVQGLTATLDHLIPRSMKRRHATHDVTIACLRCNQERGRLTAAAWRLVLADRYYEHCGGVEPSNPLAAIGYLKALGSYDMIEYHAWLASLSIGALFPRAMAILDRRAQQLVG